jgi:hypothetical protein
VRWITGTRITISDKYALSGNGNLVEKNKMLESAYLSEMVIQVPVDGYTDFYLQA